ncbi:MAG: hypothetical protein F4X25_03530, partial [Chloroflexi bacterium]|nr:hypothetical protein [Chloroflexota bacterium]
MSFNAVLPPTRPASGCRGVAGDPVLVASCAKSRIAQRRCSLPDAPRGSRPGGPPPPPPPPPARGGGGRPAGGGPGRGGGGGA